MDTAIGFLVGESNGQDLKFINKRDPKVVDIIVS